jgi:hypothetical protein
VVFDASLGVHRVSIYDASVQGADIIVHTQELKFFCFICKTLPGIWHVFDEILKQIVIELSKREKWSTRRRDIRTLRK